MGTAAIAHSTSTLLALVSAVNHGQQTGQRNSECQACLRDGSQPHVQRDGRQVGWRHPGRRQPRLDEEVRRERLRGYPPREGHLQEGEEGVHYYVMRSTWRVLRERWDGDGT